MPKKNQSKSITKNIKTVEHKRPHFSPATMEVARSNLKKFHEQSDESFLIRAEMDRKLRSL